MDQTLTNERRTTRIVGLSLSALFVLMLTLNALAEGEKPQDKPRETLGQSDGTTKLQSHQQHTEEQPQGNTGPLDTTSGGAPASSPQGQSPPGMQAAPEGSSKRIDDK